MARYAADTTVAPEQSRAEIEKTLSRYGADEFAYGWSGGRAVIGFRANGRYVRFVMSLPDKNADEFTLTPERQLPRSADAALKAWEQACRQRWRALALAIKAKLEAVESGIATFEDEFLAYTVLPDNTTVGEWIAPQIERAYETREMPALLPSLSGAKALPPG